MSSTNGDPAIAGTVDLSTGAFGLTAQQLSLSSENLFTATALPSGNRKTAVFSAVVKPLEDHERSEAQRTSTEIARQRAELQIKQSILRKLTEQAAAASPSLNDFSKGMSHPGNSPDHLRTSLSHSENSPDRPGKCWSHPGTSPGRPGYLWSRPDTCPDCSNT